MTLMMAMSRSRHISMVGHIWGDVFRMTYGILDRMRRILPARRGPPQVLVLVLRGSYGDYPYSAWWSIRM